MGGLYDADRFRRTLLRERRLQHCRLRRKAHLIIPNNADGYGVDRCLAAGASCGVPVATAYCQSRSYIRAASFRRVDRGEITGAVPATNGSSAPDEFIAIECMR